MLARAWAAGVGRVVVIGESAAAAERALALAAAEPRLAVTVGVHPHDAAGWSAEQADWLRVDAPARPTVVAAGEIGLDYHYDHSPRDGPARGLRGPARPWPARRGSPVVIHAREADDDVAAVLRDHPDVPAILHSFSSGPGLLRAGLDLRHYVSFSGMVTFKNWRLDEAILETPLDRLLVETDGPVSRARAASRQAERAGLRPAGRRADRRRARPAG